MAEKKCSRCGYRGWLYRVPDHYWQADWSVCGACWKVIATEVAIARGERRIDLRQQQRV